MIFVNTPPKEGCFDPKRRIIYDEIADQKPRSDRLGARALNSRPTYQAPFHPSLA